jgi:hypothetical protein
MAGTQPTHIMLVAADEAEADALYAPFLAQRPAQLRVVGAAGLTEAATGITAFAPHLVCAPEALRGQLPALSVPVVFIPQGADPVATVLAQVQSVPVPAPQGTTSVSVAPRPAAPPAGEAPARVPFLLPRVSITVRVGFWGQRGGVGTTKAALTAARLLARQGRRVALFDAAERGDVQLYFRLSPTQEPAITSEGIHLLWGLPEEKQLQEFDGVVVDGGRRARPFNATWHCVTEPLTPLAVARLLRLPEQLAAELESPEAPAC